MDVEAERNIFCVRVYKVKEIHEDENSVHFSTAHSEPSQTSDFDYAALQEMHTKAADQ